MPRVAQGAPQEAAIHHQPTTDAGGHHHGQVVLVAPGRAQPALPQRQRLGIARHHHVEAQPLGQTVVDVEAVPQRQVDRGDRAPGDPKRPGAPHPRHRYVSAAVGACGPGHVDQTVGQPGCGGRTGRLHPVTLAEGAVAINERCLKLGGTDVDRHHVGTGVHARTPKVKGRRGSPTRFSVLIAHHVGARRARSQPGAVRRLV